MDHPNICVFTQNIGCLDSSLSHIVDHNTITRIGLWTASLHEWVDSLERDGTPADIIVAHFQEIGGKRHDEKLQLEFNLSISSALPCEKYWCSGLVMSWEGNSEFTAIGSTIWVSQTWKPSLSIRNYTAKSYQPIPDSSIPPAESEHFMAGAKLSAAGKSRKGFMIMSLQYQNQKTNQQLRFHFTNIHLFHDEDNVVATSQSPSAYALKRERGFVEVITSQLALGHSKDDYWFLFGDLNTRLDGQKLIQNFPNAAITSKKLTLPETLKERFHSRSHWPWLKQFDCEGQQILAAAESETGVCFCEFPRDFGPTYSVKNMENTFECGEYKEERLPAWCDRVLVNPSAVAHLSAFQYWVAPLHIFDHHAVYLLCIYGDRKAVTE